MHIIFKSRLKIPPWSQKNHYSGFLLLTELNKVYYWLATTSTISTIPFPENAHGITDGDHLNPLELGTIEREELDSARILS